MPRVDVAVPCYQYGRFLPQCVASIQRQEGVELRILIIDNASTDNSVEVARNLALQDPRIEVVVHAKNLGPHASFNEAIEWATSDYFMILAADDMLAPGALPRAARILDENPEVCFAIGSETQFRNPALLEMAGLSPPIDAWTIKPGYAFIEERCKYPGHYQAGFLLVRTIEQKRAGYYRASLPHTDDLEMLLRLATMGDVAESSTIQGFRREHGDNRSNIFRDGKGEDARQRLAAFDSFFEHEGAMLLASNELRRLSHRSLAEWAYWSSVSHLVRGHVIGFWNLIKFAIKLRPWIAIAPPLNYLLRMKHPMQRIKAVVAEATGKAA